MEMRLYIIIWLGRKCIGIIEGSTDKQDAKILSDSILEFAEARMAKGAEPVISFQNYYCSSKHGLDIYVGYERDEHFRDEWDWSSEQDE